AHARVVLLASTRGVTEANFYRDVHQKGLVVLGAHASTVPPHDSSPGYWTRGDDTRTALRLLAAGRLEVAALTSERFPWRGAPRLRTNREVTLPGQYQQCEQTGRIDNFRRAAGKKEIPFQGIYFNDSDVYKWVEAAAYSLAAHPDARLEEMLNTVVTEIAAAPDADGYLNTYFTFERQPERWSNLRDLHELYCAGHLFQAAIAHHRATGQSSLDRKSVV